MMTPTRKGMKPNEELWLELSHTRLLAFAWWEPEIDVKWQENGLFPRVVALVGDAEKTGHFDKVAFEEPWVARACSLHCMTWIQLGAKYLPSQLPLHILDIHRCLSLLVMFSKIVTKNLSRIKRFLVVWALLRSCAMGWITTSSWRTLSYIRQKVFDCAWKCPDISLWSTIEPALNGDKGSLGSAILVTTEEQK